MGYLSNLRRALVGQVEAKASAVGAMIARVNLGQPVWPKRDYEKLGREGYQQNPVVARSVDLIANGVASITMEMHRGRGKRAQVLEDHPLLTLLANPNPDQDGQGLIAALVSHFIISGNLYLERTGDQLERMELYALRPDRVRIVPGPDGWPEAYEYRVGGMIRRFPVDVARGTRPLLHLKRFHPTDDWYGMSALDPAAWGIDTHSAAAQFNKALLDNSATPSGAYVYKPTDKGGDDRLSDDQYHRLKQSLEENVQGARNAGRPLLLEGGLDWKQLGLNLENLQFVDAKNQAAREIAFALGVPPMLLGIPGDNTYANYAEANRAFYRQTVIPLAQWLARALTHWFREQLGRDERLVVDLDSITALDVERQALWDKLERSSFLTVNEKREALGYQPVDGGDEVYVGAGQLPLGNPDAAAVAGGAAPDPGDETEDPPEQTPGSGRAPGDKRRLN
tara:strand:- start:4205 stop:5560 length:1356 start_codon:yes stop_codon:yes gene_type:complete